MPKRCSKSGLPKPEAKIRESAKIKKQTKSDIASCSVGDLETAINVKPLCRKNFLSYITKRQTGQPISRCFEKVVLLQLIYQEFNIYISQQTATSFSDPEVSCYAKYATFESF